MESVFQLWTTLANWTGGDACIMGHSIVREPKAAKKPWRRAAGYCLVSDLFARENLIF